MKRAQIIRPWFIFVGLRPVRPRYLADVKVAAAVHREPVGRQELGWTEAGPKPAQSGDSLARVVDDGHSRAEVRNVAADRLRRTEFADVAHRAFARRHEEAAWAVQVVPLRLVLAVAIEHLHAMILAVGYIDPAVGIASDIVRDVELARIGAGPAPGQQQLAVRRVFVDARVAITIRHIDVALRRHGGVGAAMERLATHVGGRLAGQAQRQQDLPFERALANRMVAIVGQPNRVVRRHEYPVRAGKQAFAERTEEIAFAVEHDHRMFAAVEDVHVVMLVDADAADFLERPARRKFRPVLDGFVGVSATANDSHARPLRGSLPVAELVTKQEARPAKGRRRRVRPLTVGLPCGQN
jgi:hypothetical protein